MTSLLELQNVSLTLAAGSARILQSVSFRVQPGEFVALVGPSGAGKSSLLRLLNRLQDASAGTICFQGEPLSQMPILPLRRQVMLVGQETRLLGMTAIAALHYPLRLQKLPEAVCQQRVKTYVQRLQLPPEWLEKTAMELSGGQQQQIAIARALIAEPALLLLDEPTSALDVGAAQRLLGVVQAQAKERGLAVIMSNHQLELAEAFCDRVLYLDQGHLRQDQAAAQTDWSALRQKIVAADAQQHEEWGDDDDF